MKNRKSCGENGFRNEFLKCCSSIVVDEYAAKALIICNLETNRERPKSAPYLRLKNSKKTSKCQVLSSTVPKTISKKIFEFF